MAYAEVVDVQARTARELTSDEMSVAAALLDDAAVMIDAFAPNAKEDVKKIVSCRMVTRAIGDDSGVPMGATQGSMSALGYSQSWTVGTGGSTGELYLSKTEKQMLGMGNAIGSKSPVEDLVVTCFGD